MTYRELLVRLEKLSEAQLDDNALVINNIDEEYYEVKEIDIQLDVNLDGHYILVI